MRVEVEAQHRYELREKGKFYTFNFNLIWVILVFLVFFLFFLWSSRKEKRSCSESWSWSTDKNSEGREKFVVLHFEFWSRLFIVPTVSYYWIQKIVFHTSSNNWMQWWFYTKSSSNCQGEIQLQLNSKNNRNWFYTKSQL